MATFQTAQAMAGAPAFQGLGNQACIAHGTYAVSTAWLVNDVIQMVKLPKAAIVTDVMVISDDLDSNGVPLLTLNVGYGGDPNYWINASQVARSGGVARAAALTAHPLILSEEDTLDLVITAAAATAAAGNISLIAFYVNP